MCSFSPSLKHVVGTDRTRPALSLPEGSLTSEQSQWPQGHVGSTPRATIQAPQNSLPPRPGPSPLPVWSDECLSSKQPKLAASGSRPSSHTTGCLWDADTLRLAPLSQEGPSASGARAQGGPPGTGRSRAHTPRRVLLQARLPCQTLGGHGGSDSASDSPETSYTAKLSLKYLVYASGFHTEFATCQLPVFTLVEIHGKF